jgi:hypothetical protein
MITLLINSSTTSSNRPVLERLLFSWVLSMVVVESRRGRSGALN